MFRYSAAFFFSWFAPRYGVSCETQFVCIDIQDRMTAQRHAFQCRASSTKPFWMFGQREHALPKQCLVIPLKPSLRSTKKGTTSRQRNMIVKQGLWWIAKPESSNNSSNSIQYEHYPEVATSMTHQHLLEAALIL